MSGELVLGLIIGCNFVMLLLFWFIVRAYNENVREAHAQLINTITTVEMAVGRILQGQPQDMPKRDKGDMSLMPPVKHVKIDGPEARPNLRRLF